ncbi:response regulator transcription factor [Amaricoccus sp. W119]|uniref:response regulator transcription factor n=1 Tax=Amaricoccus sp. W119 TaxID=3391833 RepID=UPI0039A57225
MTKVLVVDDHPVVAEGWSRIARVVAGCETLFASSPEAALDLSDAAPPDMLVADLSFGEDRLAGTALIARFREMDERLPILVFSMHRSPVIIRAALRAGANGYVNKDAPTEEIQEAFRTVLGGGRYLAPEIATRLAFLDAPEEAAGDAPRLTPRETEILARIAAGKSYREIAEMSRLSYKTVINIGHSLRAKLGANSLPELVIKAAAHFGRD